MNSLEIIVLISAILGLITFFIVLWIILHKKQPLMVQYTKRLFMNDTGVGKTSLAVAMAIYFDKVYTPLVLRDIQPYIETMKNGDFPNVELPDTFIASDTSVAIDIDEETHQDVKMAVDCDFYKLQLPTDENVNDIDFYSPGTFFIFDEIENKAQSREFKKLNKNTARLLSLNRKMFWNMNFIAPRKEDVDALIRRACDLYIFVQDMVNEYDKEGNIISSTWYFIEYSGANRENNCTNGVTTSARYKPFNMYMPRRERKPIEKWYFTFYGNIFEHYDSRREILYFLNHLKTFKTKKCERLNITRSSVRKFLKEHPLSVDELEKELKKNKGGG